MSIIIGNLSLEYIPDQLSVQSALYGSLRRGGKLVSYFTDIRKAKDRMPVKGAIAKALDDQLQRDAFEIILKSYDAGFGVVIEKTEVDTLAFPFKYVKFDSEAEAELYEVPQVNLPSPHFSLTQAGIVASSDIITESEVQPEMKRILDGTELTRETATWSGDVQSFTVGDLIETAHEDEFLSDFKG
ncbi:MAG: hypothetical protein P9M03_00235, partial [Candidatus Theseobacter exili]|nr:hypothetical protein [Candidatus Theseobacter exili]